MKKLLTLSIAVFALMAFMAAPTFACGEKAENAKTASAEKSCDSKATNAKMASADKKSCSSTKATTASADKKSCDASKAKMASADKKDCAAVCAKGAKATMANAEKKSCDASKATMTSADKKSCDASKASMASADKKSCDASKGAKATMANADKKSCDASKATLTGADCASKKTATTASADKSCAAVCDKTGKASMAKYMTAEQCETLCAPYGENATVRMVSIEGMTCGGCENAIKTTLTEMEGVHKVAKVCHEAGFALVVVDKNVVKDDMVTTAVANKGFKAEIIPAAATTGVKKAEGSSCSGAKKTEGAAASAH